MNGNARALKLNSVQRSRSRGKSRSRSRSVDRVRTDRRQAALLVTILLTAIFVLIGMRAYCAIIQHENNELQEQNAYIQAEIDSLSSQIVEETKVTKLEKVATKRYGMVYPTPENCIKIGSEEDEEAEGLAAEIRGEAYN